MAEVSKRVDDSLDHRKQREITNTIHHSKAKRDQDDIEREREGMQGGRDDADDARAGRGGRSGSKSGGSQDSMDLSRHREVTNTAGDPSRDAAPRESQRAESEDTGPEKAGPATGDDDWHNRSNRKSEKGKGSQPGYGGNVRR